MSDKKASRKPEKGGKRRKKPVEGTNIQVVVRCRPMNKMERAEKSPTCVELDDLSSTIDIMQPVGRKKMAKKYTYDRVFGEDSTQANVYKGVVQPAVEEVLKGYNCTIFAYGQTGTGKTFTMTGDRDPVTNKYKGSELAGVIPRTIENIFGTLDAQKTEYTVRVSYLELYNEELIDLLAIETKQLRIFDDARKGMTVHNLEELPVHNAEDIYSILARGQEQRQTAATKMNSQSSRSHSIFTITIHLKESTPEGEDLLKVGKLHLVDLAGSENVGRSGAQDKRAREAGLINQSLLTLGRVINALVDKAPHVPYRESKLTRILQDSLGGRTKTCIIATVSPAQINFEETMSTLEYAHRAKNIRNKPEVNQKMTKRMLMKEYTEEIEELKQMLQSAREKNGVYISSEQWGTMEKEAAFSAQRILELEAAIESKTEALKKLQSDFELKEKDYQDAVEAHEETKGVLEETNNKLADTETCLVETNHLLSEEVAVVEEQVQAEEALHGEATALVDVLGESVHDIGGLHAKIERKAVVVADNKAVVENIEEVVVSNLDKANERFDAFHEDQAGAYAELSTSIQAYTEKQRGDIRELHATMDNLLGFVKGKHAALHSLSEDQLNNRTANQEALRASAGKFHSNMEEQVTVLQEQAAEMISGVQQQLLAQSAALEEWSTATHSALERGRTLVDSFVLEQQTSLKEIEAKMGEQAGEQVNALATHNQNIEVFIAAQAENTQKMQHNILMDVEKLVDTFMSVQQESVQSAVEQFTGSMDASISGLEATSTMCSISLGAAVASVESLRAEHTDHSNALSSALAANAERTQEFNGTMVDQAQSYENSNAAVAESVEAMCAAHRDEIDVIRRSVLASEGAHLETTVASLATTRDEVDSSTGQICSNMASYVEATTSEAAGWEAQLEGATDRLESFASTAAGDSAEVRQHVSSMHLKEDTPTGTTPMKREYEYPRTLTTARPREAVLANLESVPSTTTGSQRNTTPRKAIGKENMIAKQLAPPSASPRSPLTPTNRV